MFKSFFQRLKHKMMARQLRKPSGKAGITTGLMMNKANEYLYRQTISIMKTGSEEHILEVGFGNGKFFEMLFQSAPELQVSGIDYSATMVKEAEKVNTDYIKAGRLALSAGSSDHLPYPADSFDKVFCINVLYFWDDASAHLQEIKRVLKPGGRFYATIRSKESMEMMPFTQFGFTKYDESDWKILAGKNGLQQALAIPIDEPEIMFKGETFTVRSLCLLAEKPL